MGHKVSVIMHRTPYIFPWHSRWFARGRQAALFLKQEIGMRDWLCEKLKAAHVDSISIERGPKEATITILAGKPGMIIGRSGQGLEELRKHIEKSILSFSSKVSLNIQAVQQPALSAAIVARSAAEEIERRIPFRRVMKQALQKTMAAGAQGVKMTMSGRLNGAEIARTEKLGLGKMSLITMRSNVDYALTEAHTVYGSIGIKVWIYRGEAFGRQDRFEKKEGEAEQRRPMRRAPRATAA